MANIKVSKQYTIYDGSEVVFLSPCDCSEIQGLTVEYPNENGESVIQNFVFKDAHGHELSNVDNLFTEDVYVKVILNVTDGIAYIQNADTNEYLEERFGKINSNINDVKSEIGYTSKNLLDCSGLEETEINGVTFTPVYDKNGLLEYIEVNGTATSLTYRRLASIPYTNGYILSGCPKGGDVNTFRLAMGNGPSSVTDIGNGVEISLASYGNTNADISIYVDSGVTVDHLRFYPMIRKPDIVDDTYEPYYKVKGLKDKMVSLEDRVNDLEDFMNNLVDGNEVEY